MGQTPAVTYDLDSRVTAVPDKMEFTEKFAYDEAGNQTFQLNYNSEADCGYGKGWGGDVFMPKNS